MDQLSYLYASGHSRLTTSNSRGFNPRAAPSSRYEFDGKRENYYEFDAKFRNRFAQQGIGYLLNLAEIREKTTRPEVPEPREIPRRETAHEKVIRENRDKVDFTEYTIELKDFKKRVEEFKIHIEKGISILESMVSPDIISKINNMKTSADFQAAEPLQRFTMIAHMIYRDHGPQGETTAREWRTKLNALSGDEKGGFKAMITQYDDYLNYLERTAKTDVNGMPIEGITVQERCYRPSDEELRGYLLEALKNTRKQPFRNYYLELFRQENRNTAPETVNM
jgi:hypothetical protein